MDEQAYFKKIGENIRKARLKRGLTQLDLGVACGFEEANIGRLENGKTNPTVRTLLKIAEALEVKLTDLVKVR